MLDIYPDKSTYSPLLCKGQLNVMDCARFQARTDLRQTPGRTGHSTGLVYAPGVDAKSAILDRD